MHAAALNACGRLRARRVGRPAAVRGAGRAAYLVSRAATPGRTLPSRSSSEAPPPVEMCDIFSARPAFSTAATESPPPMMVMAPLPVHSARVLATSLVPAANASISKTPMGPFQMMVLHLASSAWISLVASGPLSRPIQPSSMSSTLETLVLALASNLSARTTSVGRMSLMPLALALASSSLARSSLSSSTSEEPTLRPRALRKVKTMPPPITSTSHFSMSESMTPILDDTLEPPTMAAKGRLGAETAPSR
mmetsp:Transcript_10683/g.27722  ORF Transcript_10683/g.27722 Transcript_10683/m.27722 type:complete len:251 (+) Transcript_10683:611-1363(+)